MCVLKKEWQDHATSRELLEYQLWGISKYALPLLTIPSIHLKAPILAEALYGITLSGQIKVAGTAYLINSFARAVRKRNLSDIAKAKNESTPWKQVPVKRSSLLKATLKELVSRPRFIQEHRWQRHSRKIELSRLKSHQRRAPSEAAAHSFDQ